MPRMQTSIRAPVPFLRYKSIFLINVRCLSDEHNKFGLQFQASKCASVKLRLELEE